MGKIREKVRNLPVRKTILLYLIISLFISFILSAYIVWAASEIQEQIWWKYIDVDTYFAAIEMDNQGYMTQIPPPGKLPNEPYGLWHI